MALDIRITDTRSLADEAELEDAVNAFNVAATGYDDGRSLSCFLRDDSGRLVAGIDGFSWGGYARVAFLWVHEDQRRTGIGGQLLAAAEDEARRRGCRSIILDTHEFQAPWLYASRGYTQVGATVDTPVGYRQFLYQKTLVPIEEPRA
jgi:GNAT superfamily N-acetyltransferase